MGTTKMTDKQMKMHTDKLNTITRDKGYLCFKDYLMRKYYLSLQEIAKELGVAYGTFQVFHQNYIERERKRLNL
jgi:hypothetical protein